MNFTQKCRPLTVLPLSMICLLVAGACLGDPYRDLPPVQNPDLTDDPAVRRFHGVFHDCLEEIGKGRALPFLKYVPTRSLLREPERGSTAARLRDLRDQFRSVSPDTLFARGRTAVPDGPGIEAIDASLRKTPITIVLVPGVFSEFIDTLAFNEVFADSEKSAYGRRFRKALASSTDAARLDGHFSIRHLGTGSETRPAELDRLIQVTSMDDSGGRPLVRVLILVTPRWSGESVGKASEVAAIFNRRLEKYFRIMGGVPENLVLVGYSRGALLSLEMLARANRKKKAWVRSVRGLVSLGGVVWGTEAADDIDRPGSPAGAQVKALNALLAGMREVKPGAPAGERLAARAATLRAWREFLCAMLAADPSALSLEQAVDKIRTGLRFTGSLDHQAMLRTVAREGDVFFHRPVSEHNLNVRRFRRFAGMALQAVTEMKTRERLKWWRANGRRLPRSTVYYALAGTMAAKDSPLYRNKYAYAVRSPDHTFMQLSYGQFVRNSARLFRQGGGLVLNDGQMAVHKTIFWPGLIRSVAGGLRLKTRFLGIAGTHHWGLALEVVNPVWYRAKNPFPRRALLKALAATVAREKESGR